MSDLSYPITRKQFKPLFRRIMRQLSQRQQKVASNQRPDSHYQNKRKEFIKLIDIAMESKWFRMPEKGTRIYKIYYDVWT